MGLFNKNKETKEERAERKALAKRQVTYQSHPFLQKLRPHEKYVFHSDYFEIDGEVATIMSFFHKDGASDNYGVFWGINRIPRGINQKITAVSFEQIRRMSDGWIADHQTKAEGIATTNVNEQNRAGDAMHRAKANRKSDDLNTVGRELLDGGSYLNLHYRVLLKAPDLETLDLAVDELTRAYHDRLGTVEAAAYAGNQKDELMNLFGRCRSKVGHGYYFTSQEYAGSYSLVTHGLEDAAGEYVGQMVGDVNNSAVLFDVDAYRHHIVVADEDLANLYGNRVRRSDMWGSKISQSAMLNNHRVVHILMNNCDLDQLGPKFAGLTYKLDMSNGAVNMFEMFGDVKDELSIFPAQIQKVRLMAEQAYEANGSDRTIIGESLTQILTEFYEDRRMWVENAEQHREKLRIVGIPHYEVPRLQEFVSYLATYKKEADMGRDSYKKKAATLLSMVFRNLLSNNGDLFNMITSDAIDGAKQGQRVIYQFGGLMRRGKGVAMAQLVNIIGFAVGSLGEGDTVIIHGTDLIDDRVKDYITTQLDYLTGKGGRVVYIYDKMDRMLEDKKFCGYDKADYTVFGNMTKSTAAEYEVQIGQPIPPDLRNLITAHDSVNYIRRDYDNVVFRPDLRLGLGPKVKSKQKRR